MKDILLGLREKEGDFIEQALEVGKNVEVGQTEWMKHTGYASEETYKKVMAKSGQMMYHFHLCSENHEAFTKQVKELEEKLEEKKLHLDRFGVSIDYSMSLPKEMRKDHKAGNALYFAEQKDWDLLGQSPLMQPHLGDNMIGSPACDETVLSALRAGVTTMGNISQFFGWDYPEFTDVEARTKSTLKAIAYMAANRDRGTLIHSNLDDGYGDKAPDLGTLIGCALLEKYIVETLMGAKIVHSFGDMFHSPMKRLVFTSALKQIHGDDIMGSMIFANKLGRNAKNPELNTAHMSEYLLFDMAGQTVYQTGHAITTMGNQGLIPEVTTDEIIRTLEYAKELEAYIPAVTETIDFDKIDREAAIVVKRGKLMFEAVLTYFGSFIDVENPYQMLLAIKKIGMKPLVERFAGKNDLNIITADYNLYSH